MTRKEMAEVRAAREKARKAGYQLGTDYIEEDRWLRRYWAMTPEQRERAQQRRLKKQRAEIAAYIRSKYGYSTFDEKPSK